MSDMSPPGGGAERSMSAGPGGAMPGGGFRGRRGRGQTNAASSALKFDITGLEQFKRELKDVREEIGRLRQAFKDLAKEPKAFADQLARVNAEMAKLRGQRGGGAFSGGVPGGTAAFTGAGGGKMGSAMQSLAGAFGGGAGAGAEGGAVMSAGGMGAGLGAAAGAMGPLALVAVAKQIGDSVKSAVQGGFSALNNRWAQGVSVGAQFDMNAQRLAIASGRNTSDIAARLRDQSPIYGGAAEQGAAVGMLASRGAVYGGSGIAGQMGSAMMKGVKQFQDIMPGTSATDAAQMATGLEGNIAGQRRATLNFGAAAWMTNASGVTKDPSTYFKGIVQKLQNVRVGNKRGKAFTRDELEAARRPGSTINANLAQFGWDDNTLQAFWDYAIGQAALDPSGSQTFEGTPDQLKQIGAGVSVAHYEQLKDTEQGKKDLSLYAHNKSDMITQLQVDTKSIELQTKMEAHLSGIYGILSHAPTSMKGAIGEAAGNLMTGNFVGAGLSLAKGALNVVNPFGDIWGDMGDTTDFETGLSQVNPDLRGRVKSMMAANPRLQVNSAFRSTSTQKRLWEGGHPFMAPPGKSRHGRGAAVDLGPRSQLGWLDKNARKFGLDTGKSKGEPWHVQTAGSMLMGDVGTEADRVAAFSQQSAAASRSVADALAAQYYASASSGTGSTTSAAGAAATTPAGGATPSGGVSVGTPDSSGALSATDVAKIAFNAGFRGDDLVKFVGIAGRESHYNVGSSNDTGLDNSYGLWQINTQGGNLANISRILNQLGYQVATDRDAVKSLLIKPDVNAAVAKYFFDNSGYSPWKPPKSSDPSQDPMWHVDLTAARSAVSDAGLLDKGDIGYGGGGASQTNNATLHQPVSFSNTFHIAMRGGTDVDVNALVKTISARLESQMRRVQMSRR